MAVEAIKADAASTPHGVLVPFVTDDAQFDVLVPPPGRWKSRATQALRSGDFLAWAQIALGADDSAAIIDADPTNDDFELFFTAWGEASGEALGKSRSSATSSRSTKRR